MLYLLYLFTCFKKQKQSAPPPNPDIFDVLFPTSNSVETVVKYYSIEKNSTELNTLFLSFRSSCF